MSLVKCYLCVRVSSFEKALLNLVRILVNCGDKVPYCSIRLYIEVYLVISDGSFI